MNEKLIILHVIPYFQPEYGYEEYFHALAQNRLGHEVYVITSKYYNPNLNNRQRVKIKNNFGNKELNVIRLKSIEFPFSCQNYLFGIRKIIDTIKPDIVYAHGPENTLTLQISLFKRNFEFYYIIDKHKDGSFTKKFSLRLLFSIYKYFITSINYRIANLIVTFSKSDTLNISNNFKSFSNKVTEQFMAVSIETFFFNQTDRDTLRYNLSINRNDFVGIVSGRIVESKNIHILLKEIAKLDFEMKLIIIGKFDKIYKKKLKIISASYFDSNNSIIFVDEVPSNELRKYYCAADVGYWVSHMSVGILEAYACNLPVVLGLDATNYYQPVNDNLVVDNGDFVEALKKTKSLLENTDSINEIRADAHQLVKGLSYNVLAKNIIKYAYL